MIGLFDTSFTSENIVLIIDSNKFVRHFFLKNGNRLDKCK